MAAGSIDRRVARTRNLLQQALIELTTEKGYAAVTVEDICKRADVGRSTFYTHYPDKNRLKKATIDDHMKTLHARDAQSNSSKREHRGFFSGQVFAHAHATRELHRALMGGKKREVPDEIRDWICALVREELAHLRARNNDRAKLEFATRFYAGAFFEVMHWWLEQDTALSPEEIDEWFQQLFYNGVSAPEPAGTVTSEPSST